MVAPARIIAGARSDISLRSNGTEVRDALVDVDVAVNVFAIVREWVEGGVDERTAPGLPVGVRGAVFVSAFIDEARAAHYFQKMILAPVSFARFLSAT